MGFPQALMRPTSEKINEKSDEYIWTAHKHQRLQQFWSQYKPLHLIRLVSIFTATYFRKRVVRSVLYYFHTCYISNVIRHMSLKMFKNTLSLYLCVVIN